MVFGIVIAILVLFSCFTKLSDSFGRSRVLRMREAFVNGASNWWWLCLTYFIITYCSFAA